MKQLFKLSGLVGGIGFGILGILMLFSGRPEAAWQSGIIDAADNMF